MIKGTLVGDVVDENRFGVVLETKECRDEENTFTLLKVFFQAEDSLGVYAHANGETHFIAGDSSLPSYLVGIS